MQEDALIGIAIIIVLGISAQWVAWRYHLPAILLLLVFGILIGPVSGVLEPDQIFGDLLFPIVSVSVAIILFEGGLSLRVSELPAIGKTVRNLVTVGALITWLLTSVVAYFLIGFPPALSLLFGAILVVTGPTVIIPLLRQVRPTGNVGNILKWEGIVIDPVGAILAVLVFEATVIEGSGLITAVALAGVLKATLVGTVLGLGAAGLMIVLLRYHLVPDFLQNAVSLMVVVAVFVASNHLQPESGLLTVTLMGIALANQKIVSLREIVEFKETLRVLLISSLFIVLSARTEFSALEQFNYMTLALLLLSLLLIRPIVVFVSSIGSELSVRERLFLSLVAPRGIVAAAISSLFSFELVRRGNPEAELLVPLTFFVIMGTVTFYGVGAPLVARWLGVAQPDAQGVLIIGAHSWAQRLGLFLKELGIKVMLVDTNWVNVLEARRNKLPTYHGNLLQEHGWEDIDLSGIGRLFSLTSNNEVNTLTCLHFSDFFGRRRVYQLSPEQVGAISGGGKGPSRFDSRVLFSEKLTYTELEKRLSGGWDFETIELTKDKDLAEIEEEHDENLIPLFGVTKAGQLLVFTVDKSPQIPQGATIGCLVNRVNRVNRQNSPHGS